MAIKSDEIISILKAQIEGFDGSAESRTVGTVVEVGDGIAQVYGLSGALSSELLEFPNGVAGMALNLGEETVGAVLLGDAKSIKEGDTVKTTGRVVEVPVGPELIGRVVDPLGRPLDGKGPINAKKSRPVERIAPGVISRKSVTTPVQTGIKAVDALIPIGRGQRHDHQSEGEGPHLHLRRDRSEALDRAHRCGAAREAGRHGTHRSGGCRR
jgi:F-type H+-transporting ATPase subunit alpha